MKQKGFLFLTLFSTLIIISIIVGVTQKVLLSNTETIHYNHHIPLKWANPSLDSLPQNPYQAHKTASINDNIIFDSIYSIDQWGRRHNPNNPSEVKKTIALFGCSLVFGTGLSDEETLASYLSLTLKDVFVASYSLPGHGPQNSLIDMYHRDFNRELPQTSSSPTWVYVAFVGGISSHLQRLTWHYQIDHDWLNYLPFVEYNTNSKILQSSSTLYQEMNHFQKLLHKVLSLQLLSPLTKNKWVQDFLGKSSKETELKFIKAIEWMNDIAESKGYRFFVLFHPFSDQDQVPKYQQRLQNETKVSVLETHRKDYQREFYRIPYDLHPNSNFNKEFAKELAQQIKAWEM